MSRRPTPTFARSSMALIFIFLCLLLPTESHAAQSCGDVEATAENVVQVAAANVKCSTAKPIGKKWTLAILNYGWFRYIEIDGWHCETGSGHRYGYCGKPNRGIWILGRHLDPANLRPGEVPQRNKKPPRRKLTYIEAGDRIVQKPRRLVLGARALMHHIRWTHWGSRKAIGVGRFFVAPSFGMPNDKIGPTRARITYYRPINCGGYWILGRSYLRYGKQLKGFIRFPNNPSPCSGLSG